MSQLPAGMVADGGHRQVRDRDAKTVAEIASGRIDAQTMDGGPQVELRSRSVTAETAVAMAAEMQGETMFRRVQNVIALGGFGTFDLG